VILFQTNAVTAFKTTPKKAGGKAAIFLVKVQIPLDVHTAYLG
jgi:DNA-nicking Smr family endonuclease